MKINPHDNHLNFKGLYDNKAVLKGLELISDHSASFVAGASFACAVGLRPLAIHLTPKADKDNKKIISAESISSAFSKLLVAEAIALPVESAIKKVNLNPKQFLKKETLNNISLKDFNFLTQIIKLSSNLISAVPKTVLSVALIPVVSDLLFKNKKEENMKNNSFSKNDTQIEFKGLKDIPSNFVSKIVNDKNVQEFAKKHSYNDKNIAKNMSVVTDVFLTLGSVIGVNKSKKIDEKSKKPLILNKLISSTASILVGCKLDELTQKSTKNFIKKFSEINKNNPKLPKYISGINVLRPTIIFAVVYYGILPIISTFAADKLSKTNQ